MRRAKRVLIVLLSIAFFAWWFGYMGLRSGQLRATTTTTHTPTMLQVFNADPNITQGWKDAANAAAAHCTNVWLEHGTQQLAIQGTPAPETTPSVASTDLLASGCSDASGVTRIGGST